MIEEWRMNMEKLNNLKTIRNECKYTRQDLERLSGVSCVAIQRLEEGMTNVNNVKLSTLIKLAKALRVKVVDLVDKDLQRYIK